MKNGVNDTDLPVTDNLNDIMGEAAAGQVADMKTNPTDKPPGGIAGQPERSGYHATKMY